MQLQIHEHTAFFMNYRHARILQHLLKELQLLTTMMVQEFKFKANCFQQLESRIAACSVVMYAILPALPHFLCGCMDSFYTHEHQSSIHNWLSCLSSCCQKLSDVLRLLHQFLADVLTNKFSNCSHSRWEVFLHVIILENEYIIVIFVGPPTQNNHVKNSFQMLRHRNRRGAGGLQLPQYSRKGGRAPLISSLVLLQYRLSELY